MAGQFVGVSGVARKVKNQMVGVSGVARKVKTGYVGVSGVARKFTAPSVATITLIGKCSSTTQDGYVDVVINGTHYSSYTSTRTLTLAVGTVISCEVINGGVSPYITVNGTTVSNSTYNYTVTGDATITSGCNTNYIYNYGEVFGGYITITTS